LALSPSFIQLWVRFRGFLSCYLFLFRRTLEPAGVIAQAGEGAGELMTSGIGGLLSIALSGLTSPPAQPPMARRSLGCYERGNVGTRCGSTLAREAGAGSDGEPGLHRHGFEQLSQASKHIKALDGLRGLAAMLVLVRHCTGHGLLIPHSADDLGYVFFIKRLSDGAPLRQGVI
jgi:hypothetical protein